MSMHLVRFLFGLCFGCSLFFYTMNSAPVDGRHSLTLRNELKNLVHPGFLWVIFVGTITYKERNGTVNHKVSSIGGGYKSRPPQ